VRPDYADPIEVFSKSMSITTDGTGPVSRGRELRPAASVLDTANRKTILLAPVVAVDS